MVWRGIRLFRTVVYSGDDARMTLPPEYSRCDHAANLASADGSMTHNRISRDRAPLFPAWRLHGPRRRSGYHADIDSPFRAPAPARSGCGPADYACGLTEVPVCACGTEGRDIPQFTATTLSLAPHGAGSRRQCGGNATQQRGGRPVHCPT